jgi:hypothetical protein
MLKDEIKAAAAELVEHARNGQVYQEKQMPDGTVQQRHLPNCLSPHYERLIYETIFRVVIKAVDDAKQKATQPMHRLLKDEAAAVRQLMFARDQFEREINDAFSLKDAYVPFIPERVDNNE